MFWKEIIGITATLFILVSMLFNTLSFKGSLFMRILNIIGSMIFVVYGILLPAISTAVLNAVLIFVNGFHLIKLIKDNKKNKRRITNEKVYWRI